MYSASALEHVQVMDPVQGRWVIKQTVQSPYVLDWSQLMLQNASEHVHSIQGADADPSSSDDEDGTKEIRSSSGMLFNSQMSSSTSVDTMSTPTCNNGFTIDCCQRQCLTPPAALNADMPATQTPEPIHQISAGISQQLNMRTPPSSKPFKRMPIQSVDVSESSDGDSRFCSTPGGSEHESGDEKPVLNVASQELADELAALLSDS